MIVANSLIIHLLYIDLHETVTLVQRILSTTLECLNHAPMAWLQATDAAHRHPMHEQSL